MTLMNREVILIAFAVSSTFVGTAGLSIIANGVAYALGEVPRACPSNLLTEFYRPRVVSILILAALALVTSKLILRNPTRHALQHF